MFYQRESDDEATFKHVKTLQPLDLTDATRIIELEEFDTEKFESDIGSAPEDVDRESALEKALWSVQEMLQKGCASIGGDYRTLRIMIFTNDDDPCSAYYVILHA